VQESAGAITDRSLERLGTSDTAIIVARQIMLNAALASAKNAESMPPGLAPDTHKARAVSIMLPAGIPFQEGAKEQLIVKEGDYVPDPDLKG
jgi:phthalate 4,5-dioxygenase oxygenase subunit